MVNWNSVDHVFLDMDGTLLDLHFEHYFWMHHLPQYMARVQNKKLDVVKQKMMQRYHSQKGTLQWYCLEYWQQSLNIDLMSIKNELLELVVYRPGTLAFLQWLQSSSKQVVLVTNAHRWGVDMKFAHLDMQRYFHQVHSSHDFGHPKEDQAFWSCLNQVLPFNPEKTLFIDDNLEVLQSAKKWGIKQLLTIKQPNMSAIDVPETEFVQANFLDDLIPQ